MVKRRSLQDLKSCDKIWSSNTVRPFAPMAQTIHIDFKEVSYENRNYNR